MIDLFAFAAMNARAEFGASQVSAGAVYPHGSDRQQAAASGRSGMAVTPAVTKPEGQPGETGTRIIPSAGHGYTVRYTGDRKAHALDCTFCLHTVYPREHRQAGDPHPGVTYGRAKAAMIAHIMDQHAAEFAAREEVGHGNLV